MDSSPQPRAEPFRQVGPYRLLGPLGRGGMGEVFRASKTGPEGFERQFAVKLLSKAHDPRARELFFNEARTLASLRHRNVVQVFDFDLHESQPYLVMELLIGEATSSLLVEPGLEVPVACFLVAEIAEAVEAVHALGLVHGDLSPSNVMVCTDGAVKLLDFGLARHSSVQLRGAGKLPYFAPEQLAGSPADRLTDVYALVVMLAELVRGARLFKADSNESLCRQILAGPQPVLDSLPVALRPLIERGLSRDRDQRPASARVLARELRRFVGNTTTRSLVAAVQRSTGASDQLPSTALASGLPSARPARAPALVLGVGALALVLAVEAVLLAYRAATTPPPPPAVSTDTSAVAAPAVTAPAVAAPAVTAPAVTGAKEQATAAVAPKPPPRKRPSRARPVGAPSTPSTLAPGFLADPEATP